MEYAETADDVLFETVTWIRPPVAKRPSRVLHAVRTVVRRYIDFDGTITDDCGFPRKVLCGIAIEALLAQEPYIVATWNPTAAAEHFGRFPDLPQPTLIMVPPAAYLPGWDDAGKDFAALGIRGALIIDDLAPRGLIHAPGCRVIGPFDALPLL